MVDILGLLGGVDWREVALISAYYLSATVLVLFITLILFLAVIKLRDMRDAAEMRHEDFLADAPFIFKFFAYLILAIGFIFDAMLAILLSPILLDIPLRPDGGSLWLEWLTTDKMIRLKHDGNNWQKACARWLCKQLSRIDLKHCGDD
jgi:hypothetical protein